MVLLNIIFSTGGDFHSCNLFKINDWVTEKPFCLITKWYFLSDYLSGGKNHFIIKGIKCKTSKNSFSI